MNLKSAAAASLAALLVLSGCSSDGDDDAAATPAESSPAAMESEAMESPTAEEPGTIAEVASGNPDFSTLVAAVTAAGLAETLSGDGPFTVFAPTNEAFEALPEGLVDTLLLEENRDVLTQILTYHVVPGEVTSDMVAPGDVATVEGSDITVSVADDGTVMVNDAAVVAVDVMASNGVIHVIDAVLVPEGVDPTAL